jgi:ATPase subunit of ABC transporter with duplicated ATPase domains
VGDWVKGCTPEGPGARDRAGRVLPEIPQSRRISALSTGQHDRLVLWALLSHPASVLLLDEPFAHLSRDPARALRLWVRDLAERHVVLVATNRDSVEPEGRDQQIQLDGTGAWSAGP